MGPTGRDGRPGRDGVCPISCEMPKFEIPVIPERNEVPIPTKPAVILREPENSIKAGFLVALTAATFMNLGSPVTFDTLITDATENFNFDTSSFVAKTKGKQIL